MAGPYDYTVNIPQPPAQNFLQSLTGIMQLRQMQDQAEIAKQQAAFAAQMQPLQLAAERERINQLKASTGATETSKQAAAYQLKQRKDLDAELLGMSSDPAKFTADNLQKLAVRFHSVDPTLLVRAGEMRKNLPDQAKIFGDNVAKNLVITSVTGDSEEAIKQLDKQLEAAKNTPGLQDFVPKLEQLKDNFIKYPDQTVGLAAVGQTLFAPDQGKAITDVLAKQADIGKTKAETKKEEALTKKALGESATGEVEIKDVFTKKLLKESIDKSDEYSRKADSALSILNKIDSKEVTPPSGFVGNIVQYFRDRYPIIANDVTALRKDFIRINNSEAIKGLPKGSASDKDVAFAREGLMSDKTNPEQFRKAVEAMARLNSIDSSYYEAQANWVSRNGNIGDAKRDISVLGDTIPKGTGFSEWWKKSGYKIASGQPATNPAVTPAPTDLTMPPEGAVRRVR